MVCVVMMVKSEMGVICVGMSRNSAFEISYWNQKKNSAGLDPKQK